MKKVFITLVILGAIGAVIGYFMYNKQHTDLLSAQADFVLFPSTLANEYDENEETANAKYLDKIIELKGKVREISEDGTGIIILETGNPMTGIQCEFQNPEDILNLQTGMQITVRGICAGKLMDVVLSRCIIKN
jgi:hypothetical protein